MTREDDYNQVFFGVPVLRSILSMHIGVYGGNWRFGNLVVQRGTTKIVYDDIEDFFQDYSSGARPNYALFKLYGSGPKSDANVSITLFTSSLSGGFYTRAEVEVKGAEPNPKKTIADFFSILDSNKEKYLIKLPDAPKVVVPKPTVFIGHGRSLQWRELKDHLSDKHDYKIEAYETGARAGHTIRDVLDDMLSRSNFALLVLTAEDDMKDGGMRARQNVIHETGLFQGKLGFSRAIVLLEEGAEEFSNIFGIQQLRFSKDNIKEVFGDVLATLRREFQ